MLNAPFYEKLHAPEMSEFLFSTFNKHWLHGKYIDTPPWHASLYIMFACICIFVT